MGKRTSDFMALAAILGGAGLGLGLNSLYAPSRTDRVPHADGSSVLRGTPRTGAYFRITPEATAPSFRMRTRVGANGFDRARLEKLLAQVEELRREAAELRDLKVPFEASDLEALYQALDGVEALADLDWGQELTIDILRSDEDERRRRRRRPGRRPRRAAEDADSDAPGN